MRVSARKRLAFFTKILFCLGAWAALSMSQSQAQPKPGADSPALTVPVLVSDFELYSPPPRQMRNTRPPATAEKPKPGPPQVYQDTDQPSDQARRLVDFFTMTLMRTLQNKGLQVIHASGRNAAAGAQLRGVFAEPDPQNRIRRAILGAGSPSARFFLYVGVFNLAREGQPLYRLADEQPTGSDYGPIITLNNYVPLAKYELDKNPTEEEVQKICSQIAASLVTLLEANPDAFSH